VPAQHLQQVVEAIEAACEKHCGEPVTDMAAALVNAFIDAKMGRPEVSKALYAPSSELDGAKVVRQMTARAQTAVCALLATAPDAAFDDLPMVSMMLLTASVGPVQAVLEMGAAPDLVQALRKQLTLMGQTTWLSSPRPARCGEARPSAAAPCP
jgi:hypothetical protein